MEPFLQNAGAYVIGNWQVLIHAPLPFCAALIVAVAIAWLPIKFAYSTIIDGKNSTIESLKGQIDRLNGDVAAMRTQIADLVSAGSHEEIAAKVHPNKKSDALLIAVGAEDEFVEFDRLDNGRTRSQIYITLKNQGDGFLTDCLVKIIETHPALSDLPRVLGPSQSLLAGQHARILLARYFGPNEQNPPSLWLAETQGGAAFATAYDKMMPPTPDSSVFVYLEATGRTCASSRLRVKLTIDESGRLTGVAA